MKTVLARLASRVPFRTKCSFCMTSASTLSFGGTVCTLSVTKVQLEPNRLLPLTMCWGAALQLIFLWTTIFHSEKWIWTRMGSSRDTIWARRMGTILRAFSLLVMTIATLGKKCHHSTWAQHSWSTRRIWRVETPWVCLKPCLRSCPTCRLLTLRRTSRTCRLQLPSK